MALGTAKFSLFQQSAYPQIAEDILNRGTEIENSVEQSIALQGEVIYTAPNFLKGALSPQSYVNATLNLEGNTNFFGSGLL